MALSIVEVSSSASSTTSAATATPASAQQAGDTLYVIANSKPSTAAVVTPAGWDLVFQDVGGTGSAGVDTGPVKISIWRKDRVGSDLTAPAIDLTSGSVIQTISMLVRPTSGKRIVENFAPVFSKTTSNTSWNSTSPSWKWATNDRAMYFLGDTSDAGFSHTAGTFTDSGPITLGAASKLRGSLTTTGNDASLALCQATVTSGSATAATVTAVVTGAAASTGASVHFQLTEVADDTLYIFGQTPPVGGTTATIPTLPADTQSGDYIYICCVSKLGASSVSTPAGWTQLFQSAAGTGSDGAGTGQVKLSVFRLVRTGTTPTMPTLTTTGTGAVMLSFSFAARPGSGKTIYENFGPIYSKTGASTSWSSTSEDFYSWTAEDHLAYFVGPTTAGSSPFTIADFTAFSATVDYTVERADSFATLGNDVSLGMWTARVRDTVVSDFDPNVTAGTSDTGGAVHFQLTQTPPNVDVPATGATFGVAGQDTTTTRTGTPQATAATLNVDAANASGTASFATVEAALSVSAADPGPSVAVNADVATLGVAAADTTITVIEIANVNAGVATLGVDAVDAVPTTIGESAPVTASFNVDGQDVGALVSPSVDAATLSVDGQNATAALVQGAISEAAFALAAQDTTAMAQSGATAATLGVDGQDVTVTRTAEPAAAAATLGVDANTTTSLASSGAGSSDLSMAAQDTGASVLVPATEATFGVDAQYAGDRLVFTTAASLGVNAQDSTPSVGANADAATLQIDAADAVPTGITNALAGSADFTTAALDPQAVTSGNTNVNAGVGTFGIDGRDAVGQEVAMATAFVADIDVDMPEVAVLTIAVANPAPTAATFGVDGQDSTAAVQPTPSPADITIEADAGGSVLAPIGSAAITWNTPQPTISVNTPVNATEATLGVDANDAIVANSISANATAATFSVDALNPGSFSPPGSADLSIAANNASIATSEHVPATEATFAVAANDPTVSSSGNANATVATFSTDAQNAGTSTSPVVADLSIAANDPSIATSERVPATEATFSVAANDPAVNTSGNTNAAATSADFSTAALNATAVLAAYAAAVAAEFNLDAVDPIAGVFYYAQAEVADLALGGANAPPVVESFFDIATATFGLAAQNTTISTAGFTYALAEAAEFSLNAVNATVAEVFATEVPAFVSNFGVSAMDAGVAVLATPGTATFSVTLPGAETSIPPARGSIRNKLSAVATITSRPSTIASSTITSIPSRGITITRHQEE